MKSLILSSSPGTYALLLTIVEPLSLCVGQLGELRLLPGCCIYVGSALGPGGLRARIAHHARIAARPHWHIDYLRRHAPLSEVWHSEDTVRRDHDWAVLLKALGGTTPLIGFGASDCHCPTHLFHFATPLLWPDFVQAAYIRYPDQAPLKRLLMQDARVTPTTTGTELL